MKHFKKHHGGFPPGFEDAKIYICDQCPEEFLTPYNLANHKSSVHKFLSQKFICDKCDTGQHDLSCGVSVFGTKDPRIIGNNKVFLLIREYILTRKWFLEKSNQFLTE